jgi:hypothetical protein
MPREQPEARFLSLGEVARLTRISKERLRRTCVMRYENTFGLFLNL